MSDDSPSYWNGYLDLLKFKPRQSFLLIFIFSIIPILIFGVAVDFSSRDLLGFLKDKSGFFISHLDFTYIHWLSYLGNAFLTFLICFFVLSFLLTVSYLSLLYLHLSDSKITMTYCLRKSLLLSTRKFLPSFLLFLLVSLPFILLVPPLIFALIPLLWAPALMISENKNFFRSLRDTLSFTAVQNARLSSLSVFINYWGVLAAVHIIADFSFKITDFFLSTTSDLLRNTGFFLSESPTLFGCVSFGNNLLKATLLSSCIYFLALAAVNNYNSLRRPYLRISA